MLILFVHVPLAVSGDGRVQTKIKPTNMEHGNGRVSTCVCPPHTHTLRPPCGTPLTVSALNSMEKMQHCVFDDVDFSYNKCASWNGMRARLLNKNFEHVYTTKARTEHTVRGHLSEQQVQQSKIQRTRPPKF